MHEQEHSRWFEGLEPKKGVAALVHGLNMRPTKMDVLAKVLQDAHMDVLRVALTGHRGDWASLKAVTREQWLEEIDDAYGEVVHRASGANLPHSFVGYSLGGLLMEDLMNETRGGVQPKRVVLLAPGIALRRRTYALRLLACLRSLPSLFIPSFNLEEYRANSGLPLAAYNALFDAHRALHRKKFQYSNVPTLVLMDPKDEFVSAVGVEKAMVRFGLDQWSLSYITTERAALRRRYHHLITDADALGGEQWKMMVGQIKDHLCLE